MEAKRPRTHITFEKRQLIEKLLKEKKTNKQILLETGLSKSALCHEMQRCPTGKYEAIEAERTYKRIWGQRKEKRKILTEDEKKMVEFLILSGASRSAIRRKLGCSYGFIESWLDEHHPGYKGGQIGNLESRLSNIEMQLEILFDLIKEINGKNN